MRAVQAEPSASVPSLRHVVVPGRRSRALSGDAAGDVVHVWHIPLPVPPETVASLHATLDARERWRAAERSGRPRRDYIVIRGAVRAILSRYAGVTPRRLRFGRGPWGKPYLAGVGPAVEFNLSHSGDLALLAVTGSRPVGVDVADSREGFPAKAFAERYFPRAERELVCGAGPDAPRVWRTLWARKEACVKAAGARAALGLALPVSGAGWRLRVRDGSGRLPGTWLLTDLAAPGGYAACVALAGERGYRVVVRRWAAEDAVRVGVQAEEAP